MNLDSNWYFNVARSRRRFALFFKSAAILMGLGLIIAIGGLLWNFHFSYWLPIIGWLSFGVLYTGLHIIPAKEQEEYYRKCGEAAKARESK